MASKATWIVLGLAAAGAYALVRWKNSGEPLAMPAIGNLSGASLNTIVPSFNGASTAAPASAPIAPSFPVATGVVAPSGAAFGAPSVPAQSFAIEANPAPWVNTWTDTRHWSEKPDGARPTESGSAWGGIFNAAPADAYVRPAGGAVFG